MNRLETIKWIGLAKVIVENDSNILDGDKAAYTNVIGLAKTKAAFRNLVKNKLSIMDMKLVRLEGAVSFNERIRKSKVNNGIIKIAKRLSAINPIEFSTFHTYSE